MLVNDDVAARILLEGGNVIIPTETVYGLAANAFNETAVRRIFALKSRPANNPLIVHVASVEQAESLAEFDDMANALIKLWPGPLTMILPKKSNTPIAPSVTAGLDTIALRIPAHHIALSIIKKSGVPFAAPSANKSGRLTSTTSSHASEAFKYDDVPIISDNNACEYGLESTIIDLSTDNPTILRFGFITPDLISSIIGRKVEIANKFHKIKAPGMLLKHYAPRAKLVLNSECEREDAVNIGFGNTSFKSHIELNLSKSGDIAEAARNLFSMLHEADELANQTGKKEIHIAPIPDIGIGLAINDRLRRGSE